jgi:hypothetical protein
MRLDCGSVIFQEYGLKNEQNFKGWNLFEIDSI